jgi:hypothetical protein
MTAIFGQFSGNYYQPGKNASPQASEPQRKKQINEDNFYMSLYIGH